MYLLSHNIGRSREALIKLIHKLSHDKFHVALVQEVNDETGVAAEIEELIASSGYTLHYNKPNNTASIAIITHKSMRVKKVIKYPNVEIIAVRTGSAGPNERCTLFVSVRYPDGVDNMPIKSRSKQGQDKIERTISTYDTLIELVATYRDDYIIIGGDFNETLLPGDREPRPQHQKKNAYLSNFLRETEMIDAGADKRGEERFTYEKGGHKSRIDYIILSDNIRNFDLSVRPNIAAHVDHKMLALHLPHLTVAEQPTEVRQEYIKHWNINKISRKKRATLAQTVRDQLSRLFDTWEEDIMLADHTSRLQAVEKHTKSFNDFMTSTISNTLARKSFKKYDNLPLETQNEVPRQIRAARRLKAAIETSILKQEQQVSLTEADRKQLQSYLLNVIAMGLIPDDARMWKLQDLQRWASRDAQLLLEGLKHKRQQVSKQLIPKHLQTNHLFWTDRKRFYTRTFKLKPEAKVTSIESEDGKTLTGAAAVANIRESVMKVFGDEKKQPEEEIEWVKTLYIDHKKKVSDAIFSNIMEKPTEDEVWHAIAYTENGRSGLDGISNDILKEIVREERTLFGDSILLATIHLLVTGIIMTGVTPKCLRRVAMKMIPKHCQTRDAKSMRPISIIPELSKITSKVLAKRLLDALTVHPEVLHRSQRGFLRTGNIGQCIDALIDILEDNRQHKNDVHIASYDQKKAYDSVQHYTIKMSLERVNLPTTFISYVMSSLEESEAFLVTDMGTSKPFPLLTSVKQGDPLAPLIFLFVVDPLHVGLESNPLYKGQQDGYTMRYSTKVSSIAFADDFTVISNSWEALQRLHEWVCAFFRYHHMDFNTDKSFLVHGHREEKKSTPKQLPGIQKGTFIAYKSPTEAWRHLGIELTLDLRWTKQKQNMSRTINLFRVNARINRLDLLQTAIAAKEYLIPRLDIGLTHAKITQDDSEVWDRQIRECVLSRSSVRGTISKSAFHIITGIPSLQDQRDIRLSSEAYIRLASRHPPSSQTMADRLQSIKASRKDKEHPFPLIQNRLPTSSRYWTMNAMIALSRLNINIDLNPLPLWFDDHLHVLNEDIAFGIDMWQHSAQNPHSRPCSLLRAKDNSTKPWQAYTDGSTPVSNRGPSGIGVVLRHAEYAPVEVSQPFKASGNNFAAELAAILIALRLTPVNHPIDIHTDSQACVWVMKRELTFQPERKWLRTAARPIVRSIWKILQERTAPTSTTWIPSHTDDMSEHAQGNRLADELANRARENAYKNNTQNKEYMWNEERVVARVSPTIVGGDEKDGKSSYHIPGDIRAEAKRECMRQHLHRWITGGGSGSGRSGRFAKANPIDTIELCQIMRNRNDAQLLDFYLQALTDTADTHERRCRIKSEKNEAGGKWLCNEKCLFCDDAPESLEHMLACPAIVSRYSSEFKRIRQLIDPCDLLEGRLQWIQPQEKITQPLANLWKARLPYRRTEEKELQAMLSKIESHDKTAGMLGILPPRLHDVLLAYHRDSLKHAPTDSQLKSLRKATSKQIDAIRSKIMDLAFSIWKEWRSRKRQLLITRRSELKFQRRRTALQNTIRKREKRRPRALTTTVQTKKRPMKDKAEPTSPKRKYMREYRPRTRKSTDPSQKRTRTTPRKRPTGRDHNPALRRRKSRSTTRRSQDNVSCVTRSGHQTPPP